MISKTHIYDKNQLPLQEVLVQIFSPFLFEKLCLHANHLASQASLTLTQAARLTEGNLATNMPKFL